MGRLAQALHPGRLQDRHRAARDRLDTLSGRLDRGLHLAVDRQRLRLATASGRLPAVADQSVARRRQVFDGVARGLTLTPIRRDLAQKQDALRKSTARLPILAQTTLRHERQRLTALDRLLDSFDHKRVLERGFVLVKAPEGEVLTRKAQAEGAPALDLHFADGVLTVGQAGPAPKKPRKKAPQQGSLFDEG